MTQNWRKIVILHLSLLKFLDLRGFLKNLKVPLRSSSVMWDNNLSTGNRDTTSFLPPHFSYPKNSPIPIFSQNWEGFAYEFIRYCETKQNRRKIVITPLLSLTFLDTRNVLKHRRVLLRNLLVLWGKKFMTGSRDDASPILSIWFYLTRNFLKSGRVTLPSFSVRCDNNLSLGNCVTATFLPPLPPPS